MIIAENQAPEIGDGDRGTILISKFSKEYSTFHVISINLSIAIIANKKCSCELTKSRRSHGESPWRVQGALRCKSSDQTAIRMIDVDESLSRPGLCHAGILSTL